MARVNSIYGDVLLSLRALFLVLFWGGVFVSCLRVQTRDIWRYTEPSGQTMIVSIRKYSDTAFFVIATKTHREERASFYELAASSDVEFGNPHLRVFVDEGEYWFDVKSDNGRFRAYLRPSNGEFINNAGRLKERLSTPDVGNASYNIAVVPPVPSSARTLVDIDVKE